MSATVDLDSDFISVQAGEDLRSAKLVLDFGMRDHILVQVSTL